MTPNQRHLANCFETSATRFPGGDTNGRDAGGDLASRYIKCLFVSMGRYSMYSMRLPFPTPLKCHKAGFGGRTTIATMSIVIMPLRAISVATGRISCQIGLLNGQSFLKFFACSEAKRWRLWEGGRKPQRQCKLHGHCRC